MDDDNFYSTLGAGAEYDQDSEVSDADVAALTKALSDMDDMDDALFASSLKNKKMSTIKSDKEEETRTQARGLAGARTLTPPSLMNTVDSKRGTFTIKDESPSSGDNKSPRNRSILKKSATKSFHFGEFDEDDPLAGLLSDEEDEVPKKPLKKTPPEQETKDATPTTPPRQETKDATPTTASPRSPILNRKPEQDVQPEQPMMRSKSAPPPKRSVTPKKIDDINFDDDDDILGTMGFDDSPPQAKKGTSNKDDDEIQAAKSKVADLFGKKSTAASPPEKPPAGRPKEFVLDARYKKNEKGKAKKDLTEEDFSFGSYTPSAVNTLQRPDSAPPGRRSVRFADDVDDLFSGSVTLDRPARSAGRQRPSSQATGSSVKSAIDNDDDDNWLSLAIGRKAVRSRAEYSELGAADTSDGTAKEEDKIAETKKVGSPAREAGIMQEQKEREDEERPSSAGDYLGLGEDIDLDSMLSSKPAVRTEASRRRDPRSSLPWDDGALDTTAGLGSTMDSQLFGGTMSSEEPGNTHSSGLIARQVAELDHLEQQALNKQTSLPGPTSLQPSSQLSTGSQLPAIADQHTKTATQPSSHPGQAVLPHGQPLTSKPESPSDYPRQAAIASASSRVQHTQFGQSQHSSMGPTSHQGLPVDGFGDPGTRIDGVATLPARQTSPGVQGFRKEPQWRQELRLRQEQMQGGQHTSLATEAKQTVQSDMAGHPVTDLPISTATHIPPLLPPVNVSSMSQQLHEQLRQQQQKQTEDLEQALRDQQARIKAQQEEQVKQMQRLQQEAIQQQLQMQQQMIQAQTMAPVPSMMSLQSNQPFSGMYRSPAYDTRIQQLEEGKKFLENSLQALQEQHKQQLTAKENANQDYIQLVEDSFRKKEERLKQEQEELKKRYEERMEEMRAERRKLEADLRCELEAAAKRHQRDLEQAQVSMQAELRAMTETTGHSRSLQAVVDQVGVVGHELGTLQSRISGDHQQQLERQRNELEEKDKQLRVLQKNLDHQQEEMSGERSRLETMVQRLEAQIRQQNTQLDRERWSLRQEQSKLSSLQTALDEERKVSAEQAAAQQVALQQARESLSAEHQSKMAECMEERKALATERAHIVRERKELDAMVKKHMDKISRENAEREGRLAALMDDEKKAAMDLEAAERRGQDQAKEKQRLEKEKIELTREQEKLHEVAEKLRLRAQQIDQTVQDAVQVRKDGLSALERSTKIESAQRQREQGIKERLQTLQATERQIAQERLKQAEQERRFEELMKEGLCLRCQRIPGHVKEGSEAFLLPITGGHSGPGYSIPGLHSYPTSNNGSNHVSSKEELVDHLLSKAEFDHTFSVWRIAADKDKDFLEEETSFLNSLIGQPNSLSQP